MGATDARREAAERYRVTCNSGEEEIVTVRSAGHTVLASADSDVYASLRKRPSSRAERYAMGRALRREVPRKSLAGWRRIG